MFNEQITLRADLLLLPELHAFCERVLLRSPRTYPVLRTVQLLVEELFVNSCKHGYKGVQSDNQQVGISIGFSENIVLIEYKDNGCAFNPLTHIQSSQKDIHQLPPVGGLGCTLIKQLTTDARYQRTHDQNLLQLTLAI